MRDRDERNRKMVDMLARDGLFIDLDELQAKHPGSTIGRPHFALCLVEAALPKACRMRSSASSIPAASIISAAIF